MKARFLIPLAAGLLAVSSCSVPEGWSVDGALQGAPQGTRLALENFSNGRWLLVDSLTVGTDGAFGYDAQAPAHFPELMRLTLPGHGSVYFPVDSVDDVLVDASYDAFGRARVSGTAAADVFARVDSTIAASGNAITPELQRALASYITVDTTGIVSYYIVSKSIGNTPIFPEDDTFGNRIYGAAAQVFSTYRPQDPRGEALRQAYFRGRTALGRMPQPQESTMEVEQTGVLDIVRYDPEGNRHSLAELARQGKVVILSFTAYDIPNSPVYNARLNDLYTAYHDRGLEIYQIAFDDNEVDWKAAARNLPWITVWNSPTDGDVVLRSYNVGAVPLTFIIDRNGDVRERIVDSNDLANAVARYF